MEIFNFFYFSRLSRPLANYQTPCSNLIPPGEEDLKIVCPFPAPWGGCVTTSLRGSAASRFEFSVKKAGYLILLAHSSAAWMALGTPPICTDQHEEM
jgi:hypothetical protein